VRFMGEIVTPRHPCSTWNGATCALRNQLELGNGAGQQELSELNKWCGEYPQHRGSVKSTKPAMLGMNSRG
jgi:hypothetical protein